MLELLRDLWQLMRERRKLWLAPLILIMLLLGLLIIAQGTVLAPFIYAIF
jgi:hypothetical protein